MSDRETQVREAAYRLWQDEGEAHGRDADHWRRAEESVGPDETAAGDDTVAAPDEVVDAAPENAPDGASAQEGPADPGTVAASAPVAPPVAAAEPAAPPRRRKKAGKTA